jgi:hypothetical protein
LNIEKRWWMMLSVGCVNPHKKNANRPGITVTNCKVESIQSELLKTPQSVGPLVGNVLDSHTNVGGESIVTSKAKVSDCVKKY